MIPARRIRAHGVLFAALLAVAMLLSGLGIGLVGHFGSAALSATRSGVRELSGTRAELRFDVPKASGSAAQSAQSEHAERIIRGYLSDGGREVPARVTRSTTAAGQDFLWTIRADATRITPAELPVLARAGTRIETALLNDPVVNAQGVEASGTLDRQAAALFAQVEPLSAAEAVPLLLLAMIGVVTIAELARLLDGVRRPETALLRSRGASAARIGLSAAAETAVMSATGALLGAAAATAILTASGEHPPAPTLLAGMALLVVVVSTGFVAGIAFWSSRVALRRDAINDSGRMLRAAAPALVVLLTAAAAFALWRYLQLGSPLSTTSAGVRVDPIAVLAPALCLAAAAVLWAGVFGAASRLATRVAARGPGAPALLTMVELARRARLFASPLVLVAVAGGGLVLAATYTPTWQSAEARTAALHAGADLTVSGAPAAAAAQVRALPGVQGAAGEAGFSWQTGVGEQVSLAALGPAGIRSAVSTAEGSIDTSTLARALSRPVLGMPLPDSAARLELTTRTSGVTPAIAAIVLNGDGDVSTVQLSTDSGGMATATLPSGTDRVVAAFDVSIPAAPEVIVEPDPNDVGTWHLQITDVSLSVPALAVQTTAGTTVPLRLTAPWQLTGAQGGTPGSSSQLEQSGELGYRGTGSFQASTVQFQPAGSQAVPVAISRALAAATGARTGGQLSFDLSGSAGGSLTATVAAVIPETPGASGDQAALANLPALQSQRIRAGFPPVPIDRIWVRSDAPRAAAARIVHAFPQASVTGPALDAGADALGAVPLALWLGAIGGAVLALIALAVVAGELARMRAQETVVLRALGLTPRAAARVRGAELALLCLGAGVGAAVIGTLVSAVAVPGLAQIAVLDRFTGLPPLLRVDDTALAVCAAALAAGVAVIVGVYARAVAAQARGLGQLGSER